MQEKQLSDSFLDHNLSRFCVFSQNTIYFEGMGSHSGHFWTFLRNIKKIKVMKTSFKKWPLWRRKGGGGTKSSADKQFRVSQHLIEPIEEKNAYKGRIIKLEKGT